MAHKKALRIWSSSSKHNRPQQLYDVHHVAINGMCSTVAGAWPDFLDPNFQYAFFSYLSFRYSYQVGLFQTV